MIIHDMLTLMVQLGEHPNGFVHPKLGGWWYHASCAYSSMEQYDAGWKEALADGLVVSDGLSDRAKRLKYCTMCFKSPDRDRHWK